MVHKKIADQPYYNVIFYMSRTEHKYLKSVCLCLPLIEKSCQFATFSTSNFERLFYNQKKKKFFKIVLTLNAIFYITDHVAFIM